jgi:cytidylate kinase
LIITLDGPSGSGKSTLAYMLAQRFGYFYLNSGFLYRGLAYILVQKYGYDEQALKNPDLATIEQIIFSEAFRYEYCNGEVKVFFEQEITPFLKEVEVSFHASLIAQHPAVLDWLKKYQQDLVAQHPHAVVEGRNIGSVVFPDAELKCFVTASPEVRAKRLQKDQKIYQKDLSFEEAYVAVIARDTRDRERAHSPLIEPEDSIVIDTSSRTIEESLEEIRFIADFVNCLVDIDVI